MSWTPNANRDDITKRRDLVSGAALPGYSHHFINRDIPDDFTTSTSGDGSVETNNDGLLLSVEADEDQATLHGLNLDRRQMGGSHYFRAIIWGRTGPWDGEDMASVGLYYRTQEDEDGVRFGTTALNLHIGEGRFIEFDETALTDGGNGNPFVYEYLQWEDQPHYPDLGYTAVERLTDPASGIHIVETGSNIVPSSSLGNDVRARVEDGANTLTIMSMTEIFADIPDPRLFHHEVTE